MTTVDSLLQDSFNLARRSMHSLSTNTAITPQLSIVQCTCTSPRPPSETRRMTSTHRHLLCCECIEHVTWQVYQTTCSLQTACTVYGMSSWATIVGTEVRPHRRVHIVNQKRVGSLQLLGQPVTHGEPEKDLNFGRLISTHSCHCALDVTS